MTRRLKTLCICGTLRGETRDSEVVLGEPVTGPLICEKALQFHELLGDFTDFKPSTGWLKNVKARHGNRNFM